jgi:hypothetical protein
MPPVPFLQTTTLTPAQAAAQDFRDFFDRNCVTGTTGQFPGTGLDTAKYLPDDVQAEYFTRERILQTSKELFPHHSGPSLFSPSNVLVHYRQVFAILLYIERGNVIVDFVGRQGLADRYLPFLARPPALASQSFDACFEAFEAAQWKFCAPVIDYQRRIFWPANQILPLVRCGEPLGKGNSGTVWRIEIHPAHDKLRADSIVGLSPQSPRLGNGGTRVSALHCVVRFRADPK